VIKNDLSPTWKSTKIKVRDLCNGDYNRALKIDIYDWDSNGKHDIIGTVRTNLQELR
jgi:Ca2+-dependent lipid-binding protein